MNLPKPEANCSICNKSVALETAKIDEWGLPVHAECYLLKVSLKLVQASLQSKDADRAINLQHSTEN